MDKVTERTNGAVEFEGYYAGALCADAEIPSCIRDGRTDIGFTAAVFSPAEMPANLVGSIPFQATNLQANVKALTRLKEEYASISGEFEAQNSHLLHYYPSGVPLMAVSGEIPGNDVTNWEGSSVRYNGMLAPPLADIGLNPVQVAPSEIYESLDRGVVNGAIYPVDGHVDARLFEAAENFYDIGRYVGNTATLHTAINLDVWNNLDPQVQAVMTEVSAEIADAYPITTMAETDEADCRTLIDNGAQIHDLGPTQDLDDWRETWKEQSLQEWVSSAESSGIQDAQEVADSYRNYLAEEEALNPDFQAANETCLAMFNSEP